MILTSWKGLSSGAGFALGNIDSHYNWEESLIVLRVYMCLVDALEVARIFSLRKTAAKLI